MYMMHFFKFASDRCADSQLHYAVRSGDYDVCSTLLRSGAKIDIAGSDGKNRLFNGL